MLLDRDTLLNSKQEKNLRNVYSATWPNRRAARKAWRKAAEEWCELASPGQFAMVLHLVRVVEGGFIPAARRDLALEKTLERLRRDANMPEIEGKNFS